MGVKKNGEAVLDGGGGVVVGAMADSEAAGAADAGEGFRPVVLNDEGEAVGTAVASAGLGDAEAEGSFKSVADGEAIGAPSGTALESFGLREAEDLAVGLGGADGLQAGCVRKVSVGEFVLGVEEG